MTAAREPTALRRDRGLKARASGRGAERLAALWLMLRGYRILAFRTRTHGVEIDLLARRGRVLAVIEVKARRSLDEALAAVTPAQRQRLRRAAEAVLARPGMAGLSVRLDLLALAPGRWPRHVPDAWPSAGSNAMSGS
jgi:putative endonuclease